MTRFFRASPISVRALVMDSRNEPVDVDVGDGAGIAYAITRRETESESFEDNQAEFGEGLMARVAPEFDIATAKAIKLPEEGGKTYRISGRRAGGVIAGRMERLNYVEFILRE